ncbi:MAG: ABC transporter permease [Gammaproteobacteria bacterium]|nr:ABC transporter permease [Gammaproteobacteria bacterium]MCW8987879.1 ABC transporter permease [Gammaproteobacteria bacterium]
MNTVMSFKRFLALLVSRNKEFIRDRSSLSWNILMPVLIVAGFSFAFSGDIAKQYKVGVINKAAATDIASEFLQLKHIEFYPVESDREVVSRAISKVQRHQVDLLLDAEKNQYWINTESPKGYLVEKILLGTKSSDFTRQTVSGKQIRYIDWVIPGILSMNMMFSALFGVGFVIVRYRKNGMLKRLKATPITAFEYLSAQVVSRLMLIILVTAFVFYGTHYFVGFVMNGSHFNLFLVFALGSLSMISLGLIIAARISSEETAGGLLNLFSWPMMFFSGVWFSLEGAAPIMQSIAEIFPLTHVTASARAIMIDGAELADISYHLVVLLVQSVAFLLFGAWLFKWD